MTSMDTSMLLAREFPDACVLLTLDGTVAHWSQGAHEVFGYATEEAVGHALAELVVPSDRTLEQQRMLGETAMARALTYEAVRRRKDGSMLYVDITTKLLPAQDGIGPLILSAEKDVTHLKVLREAKLMEARFRDLLESTPDGIVMANPTGHIVIANSQAERLFGYAPGELRGMPVDVLLPQRLRAAHVAHRANYFIQPRRRAMGSGLDLAGRRKDGSEFPVEISLSPLRTEDGAFVMSAIRDVSERKQIERTLQEKNAELAKAGQAKDRFLAGMSHELRTPLNAIIGFTGTLLMELPGPLTADQSRQLRIVQTSARHLLTLINDLLDVAKIEAGKVDLAWESVDCRAVIEEVASTLRLQAQAKGLELHVQAPREPMHWRTDRRAFNQIVLNLASNAIKFTEQGGVTLALRAIPEAKALEVAVQDTGVGIAAEEQPRLFSAFYRIIGSKVTEGTGLGLYLSQKLADLMGGRIDCTSEPGKGSTFTLRLVSCER